MREHRKNYNAWSDDPDKDTEKLLQSADAKMYENKQMMKKGKIL